MRGFQPIAQRGKAKPFANGGPVRGPGTGTSDEVPDQVPEGTYIMPADSTQAVGEQQLAAMGGGPRGFVPGAQKGVAMGGGVPVQLSNGEYKLPPEQVHAIGVQALDQMKNATHTPVAARGFAPGAVKAAAPRAFNGEPPLFFADGGVVRGFSPRRRFADGGVADDEQKRPNSFGDAAAAASSPGVTQVSTGQAPNPAPAAPPPASPAGLAAPAPASGAVTRVGNSYSGGNVGGDVSINGQPAGGGYMLAGDTGARGLGAATGTRPADASPAPTTWGDTIARVEAMGFPQAGAASAAPAPVAARGFQPQAMQAPQVLHSGNSWQARNDLRNAQVSASSIMNNGGRWDQHKGVSPERAYAEGLEKADFAARGLQPGMDAAAMRENAATQRADIQQQGENTRSRMQMALADIRERRAAGQQATQNDLARQRLALDAARAGRAGVPSGYRPRADGRGLEPIPGGPADPSTPKEGGKLNEGQSKALAFGARMQESGRNLDALAANGVTRPGDIKSMADAVGLGWAANWSQSPEQQQVEQSQRDFVNAVLRKESGAAISNSEFDNARRQYFPQIGDDDKVIEQKRQNRELATRGMLAEVPGGQNRVQQVTQGTQGAQDAAHGARLAELQRRAASNPVLAARLREMGY